MKTITSDELEVWQNKKVYQSVPEKAYSGNTGGSKSAIVDVLSREPDRFIGARNLAKLTGYSDRGTQVELRKAITELIEIDLVPIVSCHAGFAMAKDSNMILHYQNELMNRMLGLRRRIDALNIIWRNMNDGKYQRAQG